MSCAICEKRKEKRFCPAVHGRICPQCCGEQREVTLDCPSSCVYLQQARQHERPRLLQDLEQGKALEIEALVGAVVELGRLTGIPTPHIDSVYALVSLLAKTAAGKRLALS